MSRRKKTLRALVSDLRVALSLMHRDWTHCPWCGRKKPGSAHCRCRAWKLREEKIPDLVSELRTGATP